MGFLYFRMMPMGLRYNCFLRLGTIYSWIVVPRTRSMGVLFPNLAFKIETRLNHFCPVNQTTLIKISQKTFKGVEKVCSSNLSDNEPQTRPRDMSHVTWLFLIKKSLFEPNLASYNSFKCLNNRSFHILSLKIELASLIISIFLKKFHLDTPTLRK